MKKESKLPKTLVNAIILNLKILLKVKNDSELAEILGVSQQNISFWRTSGTVNFTLILEKIEDISIDYLLTGILPAKLSERFSDDKETNKIIMLEKSFLKRIEFYEEEVKKQRIQIEMLKEMIMSKKDFLKDSKEDSNYSAVAETKDTYSPR